MSQREDLLAEGAGDSSRARIQLAREAGEGTHTLTHTQAVAEFNNRDTAGWLDGCDAVECAGERQDGTGALGSSDGLHVVGWQHACVARALHGAVHPAVVNLLHVDDRVPVLEGDFILVGSAVVIHSAVPLLWEAVQSVSPGPRPALLSIDTPAPAEPVGSRAERWPAARSLLWVFLRAAHFD